MDFMCVFTPEDVLTWRFDRCDMETALLQAALEHPECPDEILDLEEGELFGDVFIDDGNFVVILSDYQVFMGDNEEDEGAPCDVDNCKHCDLADSCEHYGVLDEERVCSSEDAEDCERICEDCDFFEDCGGCPYKECKDNEDPSC